MKKLAIDLHWVPRNFPDSTPNADAKNIVRTDRSDCEPWTWRSSLNVSISILKSIGLKKPCHNTTGKNDVISFIITLKWNIGFTNFDIDSSRLWSWLFFQGIRGPKSWPVRTKRSGLVRGSLVLPLVCPFVFVCKSKLDYLTFESQKQLYHR